MVYLQIPEFAGKGTIAKDKLDATEEVVVSDDTLGINLLRQLLMTKANQKLYILL